MKTAAEQSGQGRIHVHHTTGSNEDRAARACIQRYYRSHIRTRRKDFLEFISKNKQPLNNYQAFILMLNDRIIYFRSLKALYSFCWRRRYFRISIIRLWKEADGLHFACAPDQSLFINSTETIISDLCRRVKPKVREADMNILKAKLMME